MHYKLTLPSSTLLLAMLLLELLPASPAFAQETEEREWVIRPEIGIGVGMFTYSGDLNKQRASTNPLANPLAYHINASQKITDFLDLNFYMGYGLIEAEERSLVRNLNFQSRITSGGINASYNFDHFLREDRTLEPFVTVGFEAFEFLSKTDLFDSYGNEYFYWSDGFIRNMPETRGNEANAVVITRDYRYETDIRSRNADGFGNYSERSFAVPFGAGVKMLMNTKVALTLGVTYHWTFTDYIDGITPDSRGKRAGEQGTDRIWHTFMRLSYNLTQVPREILPDDSGADEVDTDLDSIPDFVDLCPSTPLGVEVDKMGCPLDSDGDGVADYLDMELNSPEGSIVDSTGVALTDQDFEQMYLEYTDESGQYTQYTNQSYAIESTERLTKRRKKQFKVKIGEFEGAINDSIANILLSLPDVSTRVTEDGKTIIEVGGFENLPDAIRRKIELESSGIATNEVIETNVSGQDSKVSNIEMNATSQSAFGMTVDEAISKNKSLPPPERLILSKTDYTLNRPIDPRSVSKANDAQYGDATVYRIQIGAFANRLREDVFEDMADLLVITTADGLTRYYTGAFTSYKQAASRKIDMIQQGYEDAYVAPFKGGQRISLSAAGATPAANVVPRTPTSSPNYGKVKFKVQIGSYTEQIPQSVLGNMMTLGKIDQRQGDNGATRYLVGEFNTYNEAKAYKEELISKGFSGAFVAGEYQGKIITANEAIELLK